MTYSWRSLLVCTCSFLYEFNLLRQFLNLVVLTSYRLVVLTSYRLIVLTSYRLSSDFIPTGSSDFIPTDSSDFIQTASSDFIPTGSSDFIPTGSSDFVQTDSSGSSDFIPTDIPSSCDYIPTASSDFIPTGSSDFIRTGSSGSSDFIVLQTSFYCHRFQRHSCLFVQGLNRGQYRQFRCHSEDLILKRVWFTDMRICSTVLRGGSIHQIWTARGINTINAKQSNACPVHYKHRQTAYWWRRHIAVAVEGRTESGIVAAQDQTLQTKYRATKILYTETDSKCRLCQHFDEKIDHITSACPMLAKEQYIKRYDRVCAQLQFNICRKQSKLDKNTGISMYQYQ